MSGNVMEYSFCPECGSLVSGTVCSSCGAVIKGDAESIVSEASGFLNGQVGTSEIAGNATEPERSGIIDTSDKICERNTFEYIDVQNNAKKRKGQIPKIIWVLVAGIGSVLILGVLVIIVSIVILVVALYNTAGNVNTKVSVSTPATQPSAQVQPPITTAPQVSVEKLDGMKKNDLSNVDIQSYLDNAFQYSDVPVTQLPSYLYMDMTPYGHVNVPREKMADVYYNTWGESFDYSQDYSVQGHVFHYLDDVNNVSIAAYIDYYQLVGEHVPNIDAINKELYEAAINPLISYLEGISPYNPTESLTIYVEPYVTYNDKQKMSIIYIVNIFTEYNEYLYLSAQNIDIEEGRLLSTSDLIDLDESFAQEFKDRSIKQNGGDVEALDILSDAELVDFLMDDETNIVFFSPCGLELGFNYFLDDAYRSWGCVTITLREMTDYLVNEKYDYISSAPNTWPSPDGKEYDFEQRLNEAFGSEDYGYEDDYGFEYDYGSDEDTSEETSEETSEGGLIIEPSEGETDIL